MQKKYKKEHIKEQRPIEKKIIESFEQNIAYLSQNDEISTKRRKAMELFTNFGLPSKKLENWHYSDLRSLLKDIPDFDFSENSAAGLIFPSLEKDAFVVQTAMNQEKKNPERRNENYVSQTEQKNEIFVKNFKDDLEKFSEFLPSEISFEDTILQLNTAFINEGYYVEVSEGAEISSAIELQNLKLKANTHTGIDIRIGKNARCTFIERPIFLAENSFSTQICHVLLEENAQVNWLIIANQKDDNFSLSQFKARLGRGAKLQLYILQTLAETDRKELKIDVEGEGADFQLKVINLLGNKAQSNITMDVTHHAAHSTSREILRNIVRDEAKGSFQGIIRVVKDAQKVDAKMSCKTLILSDNAEFFAKPELEIFADDVACGHGATVAQIDKNALFYLMARGIGEKKAKSLLLKAFVAQLLDEVGDETFKKVCFSNISDWTETPSKAGEDLEFYDIKALN